MRDYSILRILLAGFLLYFAWPYIPKAITPIEKVFWGAWLSFLFLVIGGNLATGLQLTRPPVMEQQEGVRQRERS